MSKYNKEEFIEYIKSNKVYTLIEEVREYSKERAKEEKIYIVGGFVRDYFLKRPNLDVDFVTEQNAIDFASGLANSRNIPEKKSKFHEKFCTATIPMLMDDQQEIKIDFCTARREKYISPAVLPDVDINTSIVDDLYRRDFTINAMAVQIAPEFGNLIDLFNGESDISNRIIRSLHPLSYRDDPTRIFRAFRFANRFHYSISENDDELIKKAVSDGHYNLLTGSRIMNELKIITAEPCWPNVIQFLDDYKLISALLGRERIGLESAHVRIVQANNSIDQFNIELKNPIDKVKILLFSIFADFEVEECKALFKRLLIPDNVANLYFLSREKISALISLYQKNGNVKNSEVYHHLIDCSTELMLVEIGDIHLQENQSPEIDHPKLKYGREIERAIMHFIIEDQFKKLTFDGNQVMKHFNIKPGKVIKEIKDKLFDALLDNEVTNDRDDQIGFIKRNFTF